MQIADSGVLGPKVLRGPEIKGSGTGNECECTITGEEIYDKLTADGYINEIQVVDPIVFKECLEAHMREDKALQMFMAYNEELANTSTRFVVTVEAYKRALKASTMTIKGLIEISEEASGEMGEPDAPEEEEEE